MFAKQLPKMLEGLGIKLDGDGKFFLNPFKKFEDQALGGKKILGAARGASAGALVGTAGMLTGAGLARGVAATLGGAKAGIQGKKFNEIRADQVKQNAIMRRAIASGSSFGERIEARVNSYLGTPGRLGRTEHNLMDVQNRIANKEVEKARINNEMAGAKREMSQKQAVSDKVDAMKNRAKSKLGEAKNASSREAIIARNKYEQMKNQGVTRRISPTKQEIEEFSKGKKVTRNVTDAEIQAKRAEIDSLKANAILGPNGQPIFSDDRQKEITAKENELRQMEETGKIEELLKPTKEEIEEFSKGSEVTETATEEELAAAETEAIQKEKAATLDYISDVISGDITDEVVMNSYREYLKQCETYGLAEGQNLTTGKALDDFAGKLSGEISQIQINEIMSRETEIQAIDDEINAMKNEESVLQRAKEDAKSSYEAVRGIEGGPSSPTTITERTHSTGYRQGGIGTGISPAQSGFEHTGLGPGPGPGPGTGAGSSN